MQKPNTDGSKRDEMEEAEIQSDSSKRVGKQIRDNFASTKIKSMTLLKVKGDIPKIKYQRGFLPPM